MERPLLLLLAVFALAWLLVLVGTVVIFELIVPFYYFEIPFYNSIMKGVFSTILGVVWLFLLGLLRNLLVRRTLLKSGLSPTS
jgi:uncharacterized membrane protein (UPF0182 family)